MDTSSNISAVEMRNFLIRRLGEKEASEIMTYVTKEIEKEALLKTDAAKKEIVAWREEMSKVFATKEAYEKMQIKLTKKVSGIETTLILWAFVFWITQIFAVYCIIKFIK
ncbi:MAG: hypothetical protein ABIN97_11555 [Ginsengibacter sp.]